MSDNIRCDVINSYLLTLLIWRILSATSILLKAIPDDIAMGIGVDSMNMSDHVEFDAPQASDLAETMAKRLLEGIPLT